MTASIVKNDTTGEALSLAPNQQTYILERDAPILVARKGDTAIYQEYTCADISGIDPLTVYLVRIHSAYGDAWRKSGINFEFGIIFPYLPPRWKTWVVGLYCGNAHHWLPFADVEIVGKFLRVIPQAPRSTPIAQLTFFSQTSNLLEVAS